MSWTEIPEIHQNGIILEYRVELYQFILQEVYLFISRTTNITIYLLKPYTEYYIRVGAATSEGIGPFSDSFRIITLQDSKFQFSINLH